MHAAALIVATAVFATIAGQVGTAAEPGIIGPAPRGATAPVAVEPPRGSSFVAVAPASPTVAPATATLCGALEAAASKDALPLGFFTRLIWRESRFDPSARSPAGAQGVAQFMPATAGERGLLDPFEPTRAI